MWYHGTGPRAPKVEVKSGDFWSDYMRENELLAEQVEAEMVDDAIERESIGAVSETFHAEIENSYWTGYGHLHGSNHEEGDFLWEARVRSFASNDDGSKTIIYDSIFTWNDRIDPNAKEGIDSIAAFAFWVGSGGTARDYDIRITWPGRTEIHIDGLGNVTGKGYPFDTEPDGTKTP